MKQFVDLATVGGDAGREDTQGCWQVWVAERLSDCTLLDVGAGLNGSKTRMAINNISVFTQDPGPGLPVDIPQDISEIPSKSYDVVTAFDVIEHVPEVEKFIGHLIRVAKHSLYLTTPNPLHTLNTHIYHYKEYLPSELVAMFEAQGAAFKSGWMMFPNPKGIHEASRSEFLADLYCYNYCAGFGV